MLLVLRSLVFIVAFYVWSVFAAVIVVPLYIAPYRWMVTALRVWGMGIIFLLRVICDIKVEVRGKKFLPKGAALIAPKHQCMFDVFGQFAWLPNYCFVMKKELVWIPLFGWHALKMKMVVVDRDGHSAALRKLVKDAKDRFKDERQMLIFPEGTRTQPGAAGDYKPGIAALYRELGLPVYPMATNSGVHWPSHGFLRHPGTIVFEYLEPIPPGLKRGEFMRTLEERIETASLKLLDL